MLVLKSVIPIDGSLVMNRKTLNNFLQYHTDSNFLPKKFRTELQCVTTEIR